MKNKLKYENRHKKLIIIVIFNGLIETPFNTKFGVNVVSWWVFLFCSLLSLHCYLMLHPFDVFFFPSFQFCDLHHGYGKKIQSFVYFKYNPIARWIWIKWPHTHLHPSIGNPLGVSCRWTSTYKLPRFHLFVTYYINRPSYFTFTLPRYLTNASG